MAAVLVIPLRFCCFALPTRWASIYAATTFESTGVHRLLLAANRLRPESLIFGLDLKSAQVKLLEECYRNRLAHNAIIEIGAVLIHAPGHCRVRSPLPRTSCKSSTWTRFIDSSTWLGKNFLEAELRPGQTASSAIVSFIELCFAA